MIKKQKQYIQQFSKKVTNPKFARIEKRMKTSSFTPSSTFVRKIDIFCEYWLGGVQNFQYFALDSHETLQISLIQNNLLRSKDKFIVRMKNLESLTLSKW